MQKAKWNLYWSPEGKQIAENVEASTAKAAKRKAPKPYRTYQGEIYAMLANPNGYKAVVSLKSDGYMLGGARSHESSAFELESDAKTWADTCMEINRGVRPMAELHYHVFPVLAKNPIKHSEIEQ